MNTTARTTVNILAVDVMRSMAAIASALGRAASEVSLYQGRADQLTTSINTKLRGIDGMYIDGLTSAGTQGTHASQIANSYAVGFAVAPSSSWSQIATYLAGLGMQQGPMTAHWLLKAFNDADRPDQVVARLTDQAGLGWAKILSVGGTFTWEGWSAPAQGESESHGWARRPLSTSLNHCWGCGSPPRALRRFSSRRQRLVSAMPTARFTRNAARCTSTGDVQSRAV